MRVVFPSKVSAWLQDPRILLGVYVLAAAVVALHKMAQGLFQSGGLIYPPYQNYVIFRNAFFHLLARQDLYSAYPIEQADLFKYSPTFALMMAPIAALPYTAGAVVWNVVNAVALFGAVMWVPALSARARAWVLWFVLLSLISSMQTAQSNGLMAGLMLAAFAARERNRNALSALSVVAAALVKPFGGVALLTCLARPGRGRFLAWASAWGIVLCLAPLVVVPAQHLVFLYRSWFDLLQSDHAAKAGLSVMAWLEAWFGLAPPKDAVIAAGGLLLVLPMARRSLFEDSSARTLLAASVLIWVVIFNHMAESPTYVIAVVGVALWYFSQPPSPLNTSLVAGTFLLTCLAATDLCPRDVRTKLVAPYVLKAVPCILVWLKLQYELLTRRPDAQAAPR
jgi:Glycosyltransferase family 87